MKLFNKSPMSASIALALAVGVGAVGLTAPETASASRYSEDGLGQALIFPYYTVRDGYRSLFNITNTSGDTIAVKVRFRESHNSRDVLDFNLVMSPYDVWTGFLTDSDAGPVLNTSDTTCTVPSSIGTSGQVLLSTGYTGNFADSAITDIDRAREGYVEVILMGRTEGSTTIAPGLDGHNPISYYAKHTNTGTATDPDGQGVPRDCTQIDSRFVSTGAAITSAAATADVVDTLNGNPSGSPEAARWFDAPLAASFNPLKGNFSLINNNGTNQTAAGIDAIAIANWTRLRIDPLAGDTTVVDGDGNGNVAANAAPSDDPFVLTNANGARPFARTPYDGNRDGDARGNNDFYVPNLVTAQTYPYFLEPTLASSWGLWSVDELFYPLVGPSPSRPDNSSIVDALQTSALVNEWATRPGDTGAEIDWVVTMPLKNFFVDAPNDDLNTNVVTQNNLQAAINTARGYTNVVPPAPAVVSDLDQITDLVNLKYAGGVPGGTGRVLNLSELQSTVIANRGLDDSNALTLAGNDLTINPIGSLADLVPAFTTAFNGRSAVALGSSLYDREEGVELITSGPVPSPGLPSASQLNSFDYEVNVISFDNFNPLSSGVGVTLTTPSTTTFGDRGWMSLGLEDVPAVGFIWKYRNSGSAELNYSQIIAHGRDRNTN